MYECSLGIERPPNIRATESSKHPPHDVASLRTVLLDDRNYGKKTAISRHDVTRPANKEVR